MENKKIYEKFYDAIEYIKTLLTYDITGLSKKICYIRESDKLTECYLGTGKLVIISSGFFEDHVYGEKESMSLLAKFSFENVPVLFGNSKVEHINDNIVVYADLIASSYYFLSRYEEYIYPDLRDMYGNYPARESFLYKNDLLDTPIIDKYSKIVLGLLGNEGYSIPCGINKMYFTHDIDVPFERYSTVLMCKTIGKTLLKKHRLIFHPFLNWLGIYKMNPRATWNYMLEREQEIKVSSSRSVESICFIVALEKADEYSMAYIEDKKTQRYLNEMESQGAIIGLHTSYRGAETEKQMIEEKRMLEKTLNKKVTYQRNHYLRQINPLDMQRYEKAGFTDDFTVGFNEVPGFKLGTSRSVKWIEPKTGQVHDIWLHGLQIMDGSLSGSKPYQMQLGFEEAKKCCKDIIDQVYQYHGDLNVLWHNGMFEKHSGNYQKELYDWVIDYCLKMSD